VDVVFLDVSLPDGNGLEALAEIKFLADSPEVIILTGRGDADGAELAIQGGVWDYLLKPSPIKETMLALERALKYRDGKRGTCAPVALLLGMWWAEPGHAPVTMPWPGLARPPACSSPAKRTGKELSRGPHANSARSQALVVDCAASRDRWKALFGHKKGLHRRDTDAWAW
jgi:two-component system NtrC family response regulator